MRARAPAYPLVSIFVALFWLALNQSVSPGHAILGVLLGLFASFTLARLQPPGLRPGNLPVIFRLAGHVAAEVLRSNVAVARLVLRPRPDRTSGFVEVTLALKDPNALAVLSCILTATPGSLWVDFEPADGRLLLHVLDLVDEDAWVETVKDYERRLQEIFR